ncbi:ubiquitin 3 binding protein But2 C-terminal domain-containing protein [Xylaria sp. CBS 124048]|nr:ubiquitin 3 binding protein But2 C-terminal domain-containing protein [Xylaria sp. CBS 124048]
MKLSTSPLIFSISLLLSTTAQAQQVLIARQGPCSFHLRTEGSVSFDVSQFDSGQARAGPNAAPSTFTINGDSLSDTQGRACWWTPPTQVLQCDAGQNVAQPGFGIGCDGLLSFAGATGFQACRTGENDGAVMIYREPNGSDCSPITIRADSCLPGNCQGCAPGSGGGGSAAPSSSSTNTLPLQALTDLPGLIASAPTAAGNTPATTSGGNTPATTSGGGNSATSTMPLQGLTNLPGFLASGPGMGGNGAGGSSAAPTSTGTNTLPLHGLTAFQGWLGARPT